MQVAAAKPKYVKPEDVPAEDLEAEKAILKTQAEQEGKPSHIAERIVEGRIAKYYTETCLLQQPYIRDSDKTIDSLVKDAIAQLGENIVVKRFVLYVLGQ